MIYIHKEMCHWASEGRTTQAQMILIVTNLIMTLLPTCKIYSALQVKW